MKNNLQNQKRGLDIIHDPLENKGSAFKLEERDALGLTGLVPSRYFSIEDQVTRVMNNYQRSKTDLDRYVFLEALHDRNETLYYRLLLEHIEELTPIVYTPTVGTACQQFGNIFRRSRGMYFGSSNRGTFKKIVKNWPYDVDIIVVTDGSRILGLGDLGVSGMGIPIGKLSLYVTCAGIHPSRTLPIVLDVGTNNEEMLNDPLYMGEMHPRIDGEEYDNIVEEFIEAVIWRWPNVLIQFEDFTNDHAIPILEKYRHNTLCFNDDIQGTGAVAFAGILASLRYKNETLSDQKIVCFGAGSAAIGILNSILTGLLEEGLTEKEARNKIWMLDSKGLITLARGADTISNYKLPFARTNYEIGNLEETVRSVKPSILLGLSGQPQTFSETIIKTMNENCSQPMIFALSNPTSKAECTAEQAYNWTNGEAIFASGSPFDPVTINGKTHYPGQGNNMYIFPGVGLGSIVGQLNTIPDAVFFTAAKILSECVSPQDLEKGRVYPALTEIRDISLKIAIGICRKYSTKFQNMNTAEIQQFVKGKMYYPEYS
mgnify:CR=1 FL=1